MFSAELSIVCVYPFIMTPDTQPPSESFNTHVNISSLTRSSRRTCHNMNIKLWLILPVYSFVFIQCDCELRSRREQETDGAMPFIRSKKKTKEAVLALQRLMCRRYKHAASVYVSCSLRRFQVSRQKGGQAVTPLRKPFLKELGSAALLCWPPKCLGSEIRGEWKEELEDTYVIPCPLPSVFCDQVSYARGFRALLSAANSRWDGGSESSRLVMPLIRHYNPCPGCLAGHISQLSLRIHQRRACMAYKHARFKQHSAAYYSPWWMPGSGLDVLEELNSTPVSIQQAVFEISSDKVK